MAYNAGFPVNGVDDQGWKLYITSLIMVISAGLFVIWRLATRLTNKTFGSDDIAIIASLTFSIVLSICINLAVVHGYGMHKADLSKTELSEALKWFFIAQTPYKVVVCLYKISVLLFYKRIFVHRWFQIACWSVLTLVVAWSFGVIFATIFQCVPIRGAWDTTVKATCIDTDAFWIAFAVSNVLTDVIVLALPIPSIFHLHLKMRERILLLGCFMLGGFVVVCGILRVTSVANSLANRADTTYNFIPRGIWTLIEANVGIICACLPILKGPFMRGWVKLFGRRDSTRDKESGWTGGLEADRKMKSNSSATRSPSWTFGAKNKQINPKYESGSVEMLDSDSRPLQPRPPTEDEDPKYAKVYSHGYS